MDDVCVDCPSVRVILITPDRVQQTIATERLHRMSDEVGEQGELFCRKFDRLAGAQDFVAADVYFDIAKAIDLRCRRLRRSASEHSLHAGHQFANGEWLSDVVVGAE